MKVSNISPKIITGDNIYIAVETAVRAGIISQNDQVVLLEGAKQENNFIGTSRTFKGVLLTRIGTETVEEEYIIKEGEENGV